MSRYLDVQRCSEKECYRPSKKLQQITKEISVNNNPHTQILMSSIFPLQSHYYQQNNEITNENILNIIRMWTGRMRQQPTSWTCLFLFIHHFILTQGSSYIRQFYIYIYNTVVSMLSKIWWGKYIRFYFICKLFYLLHQYSNGIKWING